MSQQQASQEAHNPRETPLAQDMVAYIDALTQKAEGVIAFRTGSGRVFTDLLIHWPVLEHWEEKALELCQRITGAVYPLAGDLFAQGVEITATISNKPVEAPHQMEAMATCVIFDVSAKTVRTYFLSPEQPLPADAVLRAEQGLVVLCRPLHLHYHTVQDDRELDAHPHIGIFEMAQRLINELYAQPPFIAREQDIIAQVKAKIDDLPKTLETAETAERLTTPVQPQERQPALVIPAINSLSSLPSAVQALERLMMVYVIDPSLSADLRAKLRYIVQALIAVYPQALIGEAARRETAHAAAHTVSQHPPKTVPSMDMKKPADAAPVKHSPATHPDSLTPQPES